MIKKYRVTANLGSSIYEYSYDVNIDFTKAAPYIYRVLGFKSCTTELREEYTARFLRTLLRKLIYMSMAVAPGDVLGQIRQESFWFPIHDGSCGVKVLSFDDWSFKPNDSDIVIEKLETKSEE